MSRRALAWILLLSIPLLLPVPAPGKGGSKEERKRITEILKELRLPDPQRRMEAVRKLQEIGSRRAVELIVEAVKAEKDWEAQIHGLRALEALKNPRGLEAAAFAAVRGEIILVRRAAVKTLRACDDGTAFDRLKSWLSARDEEGRRRVMEALAELGGKNALRLAIFHFGDRNADVRAAAAVAAGRIGDTDAIPALGMLRREKDPLVRTRAILALAKFDHAAAHAIVLEEMAKAQDDYITRRVVPAAAAYETERIVEAIQERWRRVKGLGKARLCRVLGSRRSDAAFELLMEGLGDRDPLIRADAARALGRMGQARAVEPLLGVFADRSVTVRLMALRALRTLMPKERLAELVELALGNDAAEIRVEGAVIAADEDLKEALPTLGKLVLDGDWEVATAAMISLGRLGHDKEAPVLLPVLGNRDWRYRGAAVEGLFLLRHASVIPPLIKMVGDPHTIVKSAAVKSLQVLTQQKLGAEPGRWRKWWEENGGGLAITKKGAVVEGGQRDRYAKDRYLVEILRKARLLVVLGKWDEVQLILDDLDIDHTLIRVQQLKTIGLNPKQLILFNCEGGGGVDRESTNALRWFVNTGGYVITTDWALETVVKDVWPGRMQKWQRNTTRNDAVTIEPALPDDPILKGVFDRGLPLKWWLEVIAFAIEIVDPFRVDVLVDSLEMMDRYTLSPMLARFSFGHGKVMNSVSHFYLQKEGIANLTTRRERMVFAADNLGLSLRAIRELDDQKFFDRADTAKVTKDYSMFRLIVNFVDEKKRRVEQE